MNKIRYAVFALAALVAVGCVAPRGNNTGATSPKPEAVGSVSSIPMTEPEITLAEFDQIQNGMTYDQVVAIVGVNGEVKSESDLGPAQYWSKTYEFKGTTPYSTAMIIFTGGKVSSKMQFGLI